MSVKIEKILSLKDGEHRFHFDTKAGEIGLDSKDHDGRDHFERNIGINVVLTKTNHVYYFKLHVAAEGRFLCDRCLEDVPLGVEGSFEMLYSDKRDTRDPYSEDTEIRRVDIRKENEIRIDRDVVETLELAIPNKILCRENCKGLCVECGANLNEKNCEHAAIHDEARLN